MTLEDRRAEAIGKFREVTVELLRTALDADDEGEGMQGLFEALAHELGFVEGQVLLFGGDQDELNTSKRMARYAGMRECLAVHDEDCDGCEGSDALRQVVEAN